MPVYTALVMFMLWPSLFTKLLESMLTVLTHLLHIFENAQNVSGFVAVFFLQPRSAVLDCGHTPGQHAQCLNTPATHIHHFIFFWVMVAGFITYTCFIQVGQSYDFI